MEEAGSVASRMTSAGTIPNIMASSPPPRGSVRKLPMHGSGNRDVLTEEAEAVADLNHENIGVVSLEVEQLLLQRGVALGARVQRAEAA
jgi:hypothetical protein